MSLNSPLQDLNMMKIKVNKIYSYQTLVYKNGSRTFRKKKYNEYIKEIGEQLDDVSHEDDVSIHIIFKCKDKRVGDIDNITKPILDTLQEYGVINNDKQVIELHLRKVFNAKQNEIDILIQEPSGWLDRGKNDF